ncbi:MAG: PEGA domain-containing protein [Archangium sp.]|nr:PEGA domain-containing protein [Archangium sp.]
MTVLVPALVASLAAAPANMLAVVDVDAPDSMQGLASQVTRAITDGAAAMQLPLLSPDAVRTALTEPKYATLRRCGGAPACAAQFAPALGVTRLVLGSLTRDDKHYLLRLWLIDTERLEVVADVDRQVLIAARRLQRDVEQAVPPLLRGEREARGTLRVTCAIPNVRVSIDGEAHGSPPVEVQLKPGKHTVRVEKTKYLTVNRLVTVEADQRTDEDIRLLLTPGEIDDDVPVPGLPKERTAEAAAPPASQRSGGVSVLTWVWSGATVAALGVGIAFAVQAGVADSDLSRGFNPTTGVYAGTRRQALTAQSNALVANIGYGAAAALGIGAVISLVVDLTSDGAVQASPTAGTTGAGITVWGHF